jgi:copper chaperone CopZ
MVCDFCARGVEKTFQKQVAVRDIQVDLAKGVILLAYDSGYTIDKQAVARGVLDNGLNLVGVEVLEF